MKITSNEIAKIVGVSRSTVSKVLNNYPSIPEKTRKKVLDAIEKYGYEPNFAAQSLAGKENRVIGVFIGDIRKKSDNLFSVKNHHIF
ncbi:MAG: LacI family transcriptional regulator [Fusobacteriaceae bacterium]|jgi:LacI family transcriptional regulator|nr:LacI family transcriptional regulator [Fusobacteriaceae bacterium]